MNRYSGTGQLRTKIDELVYNYGVDNANQLLKVKDDMAHEDGFKDVAGDDYAYDDNGNMISDANKGITAITYNILNKPDSITFDNGTAIKYIYDASGVKLSQKLYNNGTLETTTDYIGNMVYENDTLQFFGHPEGRVVFSPPYQGGAGGGFEYQYTYTDHLGNVRLLYTANPDTHTFTATMETEVAEQADDALFANVDETNAVDTDATSYNEVSRLFSSQPVGPGISLPMFPGDKATMSVKAYHRGGSDFNNSIDLNTFITTLAGAFGGVNGGTTPEQTTFDAFDNALNAPDFGLMGTTLNTRPAAYLNYILFDKNMNMYQHGHAQISESGTLETLSLADVEATKEGWIYVYLSNESNSLNEVYFDDMVVTIEESIVVQNTDYYPFGLQHNTSWTRPTDLKNRFLYNAGSELNDKTKNYETFYRHYDPALGRMTGIDPVAAKYSSVTPYNYAFNDPVALNDPWGDDPHSYRPGEGVNDYVLDASETFGYYRNLGNVMSGLIDWNSIMGGRQGVGSGGHWSDFYRSDMGNWMLMPTGTFNDFFGDDADQARFNVARQFASSSAEAFASVGLEVVTSQTYDPDLAYSMMPVHTLLLNGVFVTSLGADFFADNMGPIRGTAGGFGSGLVDGFGGGVMSTWNLFTNDLWTGGFWLDQAKLGLDMMTGKALFNAAEGAVDFAQAVPNMSSYDVGYVAGFGVEKAVEAALLSKGAGAFKGLQFKWLRGSGGSINGFTISKGSGYGARPRFDFHKLGNSYNSRATSRMTIPKFMDGWKLPHWHRGKGNNLRYHRPWEIGPDGKRRW